MARKQKTIHYLYKTTCLITGRYYIGMHSTCNINDGYMGSGKRLRYSLKKYGKENHLKEKLEFFETRELLKEAEKKAITTEMVLDVNCMNLMSGGTGGFVSEEQQRHRSVCGGKAFADKLKNDEGFNEIHSKRVSEVMTNSLKQGKIKRCDWTGRKHTLETILKMKERKYKTGDENKSYGLKYINNGDKNKAVKPEELESYLNDGWVKGRKKILVKQSMNLAIVDAKSY